MHIIRVAWFTCFCLPLHAVVLRWHRHIQITGPRLSFPTPVLDLVRSRVTVPYRLRDWDMDRNRNRGKSRGRDWVRKGSSTLVLILLHAALCIHVVQGMKRNRYWFKADRKSKLLSSFVASSGCRITIDPGCRPHLKAYVYIQTEFCFALLCFVLSFFFFFLLFLTKCMPLNL